MDTMKQLICSESSSTREHVYSQHVDTRKHVVFVQQSLQDAQKAEAQIQQLLQSLWFEMMQDRQIRVDWSYAKTFDWLFEPSYGHNGFADWLLSDKPLFWVNGKAGSGKSTLMKFLFNDQRTKEHLPNYSIYSFFLWKSGSEMQRTRRGMFCSLLYQMLEGNDGYARHLIRQHPELLRKRRPADWDSRDLEATLQQVLEIHEQPVFLFIDGLDEMDSGEDTFDLKRLATRTISRAHQLKICVSSRPEPIWATMLQGYPSLRLQDLTKRDLETVARGLLTEYFDGLVRKEPKHEIDELVDLLVQKSSGVFLWLHLGIRSLLRGLIGQDTLEELKERIDQTPSTLNGLYQSMWARLGDDAPTYRLEAAKYFRFLVEWYEVRQVIEYASPTVFHLTLGWDVSLREKYHCGRKSFVESQEFTDACAHVQRRIETRCGGLLELLGGRRYELCEVLDVEAMDPRVLHVQFIHRTVKDWLLTTGEDYQLLENCLVGSARIAIADALICESQILENHFFYQGFHLSHDGGTCHDSNYEPVSPCAWRSWRLDYHAILFEILRCCKMIASSSSALWKAESANILKHTSEGFEARNMTSLYDEAAALGLIDPIRALLDSRDDQESPPYRSLLSYLACERRRGRLDQLEDRFLNWAEEQGAHMHWRSIHTMRLTSQGVPYMESSWISYLRHAYSHPWLVQCDFNLLKDFRRQSRHLRSKVFLVFTLFDSRFVYIDEEQSEGLQLADLSWSVWSLHEDEVLEHKRCVDIIVEVNAAQLFNETIARGLALNPRLTELSDIMYRPEQCHSEVLIVGSVSYQGEDGADAGTTLKTRMLWMTGPKVYLDGEKEDLALENVWYYSEEDIEDNTMRKTADASGDESEDGSMEKRTVNESRSESKRGISAPEFFALSNARYCVPTKEQAVPILDSIDVLQDVRTRDKEPGKLVDALYADVEKILATGENRIVDVAETLRQKGHFILSGEQVLEYNDATDLEDRVQVLHNLNQLASAMEDKGDI